MSHGKHGKSRKFKCGAWKIMENGTLQMIIYMYISLDVLVCTVAELAGVDKSVGCVLNTNYE